MKRGAGAPGESAKLHRRAGLVTQSPRKTISSNLALVEKLFGNLRIKSSYILDQRGTSPPTGYLARGGTSLALLLNVMSRMRLSGANKFGLL